jgi:hypothetical protein
MILHAFHFQKKTENIDQILWNENLEIISLQKMTFKRFEEKEVVEHYNSTFKNFPLVVENSSKEIGISIFSTEFFEIYYDLTTHNRRVTPEKKRNIFENRKNFEPKDHIEIIDDFIEELIHCLIYKYDEFLENTMKQYYFVGINDEVKILLSILNLYKSVIKNKTKQIDIFWSIRLNKQISDLILEILIEFIEQRLDLLTISIENINFGSQLNYVENKTFKLDWNGTQQELGELILELENKKWISEIKNGERRKVANSITQIFNITKTQKNKNSNSSNSFYQLLKGEYENKLRIYPFLEKENYEKKFNGIFERKE